MKATLYLQSFNFMKMWGTFFHKTP